MKHKTSQANHSTDEVHKQKRLGSIWHKTHKLTRTQAGKKHDVQTHTNIEAHKCRGAEVHLKVPLKEQSGVWEGGRRVQQH